MKKLIAFIFLNIPIFGFTQNLCNNPSFEYFSGCPNDISQIDSALYWNAGVEWGGSSDYYNSCMLNMVNNDFVLEIINKNQARSGIGFSGILLSVKLYPYLNDTLNYREAIHTKLKQRLLFNTCYKAHFYIKFNGFWVKNLFIHNSYAINSFGMFFHQDSILYENPWFCNSIFNNQPQIEYNQFIIDSTNWIEINGLFIANGTEEYLTITTFKKDNFLNLIFNPNDTLFFDSAGINSYYLIDDVAVYPCDAPIYTADAGVEACVNIGNSATIGTPRRDEYLYWWYDAQGNLLDTTAQITVNPTQTTTYYLVQKDFKFDETRDSVTVTVGNCPLPDYSNLDFEIYPNPCNGIVNVRFNAKIPEGTVMQLYDMIGQEVAKFPLTSTTNIATINLGELATAVYHATVVVPDIFRKSVKLVVIRYD